ncbi:MAG: MarR family winged helix-turn-helix transcriptional regulator [Anaerolineales bacterium]
MLHELYVLSDALDRLVFEEFGINSTQYRLLTILDDQKGKTMTTLSEQLILSKSSITRIVDQLEQLGWVMRVDDPEDRRVLDIVLTAKGLAQRAMIISAHESSLRDRMQSLDKSEQKQFENLLERLRNDMRSEVEGESARQAVA